MKKIITLVFSVGLFTAAFAQQGNHRQNDPRSNTNSYTTQSNHNSGNYANNDRSGQYENRGDQDQYRRDQDHDQYDNNRNDRDGRDRDDQYRRMPVYHQPQVRYDNYRDQDDRRVPLLQLFFGIGRH